jgi:hypothetical protein
MQRTSGMTGYQVIYIRQRSGTYWSSLWFQKSGPQLNYINKSNFSNFDLPENKARTYEKNITGKFRKLHNKELQNSILHIQMCLRFCIQGVLEDLDMFLE